MKTVECKECDGYGTVPIRYGKGFVLCLHCGGRGVVKIKEENYDSREKSEAQMPCV